MLPRLTSVGSRRLSAISLAVTSLVAAAALGSVFLSTAGGAWRAIAAAGPAAPADGMLLVTGLVGTLLTLWLGLGVTLSALSALPGALGNLCRELAARVAPAAVRKVVAFVLGTSLTAAFVPGTAVAEISHEARPEVVAMAVLGAKASLAVAAPDASFRFISEGATGGHDVTHRTDAAPSPSWSLDGSGNTQGNERTDRAEGPERAEGRVVVLRGDTLWSIAAKHLGPAAGAAAIDAEWRRWFAVNRDVIGDEADRILPGQVLTAPPPPLPSAPTRPVRTTPRTTLRAGS